MFTQQAIGLMAISALASACAPELYKRDGVHPAHIVKRQHIPNVVEDTRGWTFDQSEEWNTQNPAWGACFSGTQQSPIAFNTRDGLARSKPPTFSYPDALVGTMNNWDFGPQFAIPTADDNTTAAHIVFEQDGQKETAYFRSWHTHAPAEHSVDGRRPKGELHYVHYDAEGNPRAVVGFLLDLALDKDDYETPTGSAFYQQFETMDLPTIFENRTMSDVTLNLNLALQESNNYENFWTYKGSLTTPPCTEGLRWFVSKDVIYLSSEQMAGLLGVSTFSARPTHELWNHQLNA